MDVCHTPAGLLARTRQAEYQQYTYTDPNVECNRVITYMQVNCVHVHTGKRIRHS